MRFTGVTARGIVAPIFHEGDDLVSETCRCVIEASEQEGFALNDGDIIAVTEAVVGRTQGNYASCEQIAAEVRRVFGGGTLGIVFPITSRNRFSVLLKSIAMGCEKLYVQLSYPADEVGNQMITLDQIDDAGVNPYSDSFTEAEFRGKFGYNTRHGFTGVDYIEYYKSLSDHIELVFSNDPRYILNYTDNVLVCDIHSRFRTERKLRETGKCAKLCRMDQLLNESLNGSGYNAEYGLLGSNMATEESVKLFPRDTKAFVDALAVRMFERTGKKIEVMVYGDGGFKDPVGGIWELADPVVSPAYTSRLNGTPNEIKIKYLADTELSDLTGDALADAMRDRIREKDADLKGRMTSQGTTPRRFTDLLGSLADLVSGSGDRGTPIVLIQNYFTNYASQ